MSIQGLLAFPTAVPTAGVFNYLVEAFKGGAVDKAEANHVAWHVYGYLSGKFAPSGPIVMRAATRPDILTDEAVEAACQAAIAHCENGVHVAASPAEAAPVWAGVLINVAIRLLERFVLK